MNKMNLIKTIAKIGTICAMVSVIAERYTSDQLLDDKIEEKVNKAIADKELKES